MSKRAWLQLAGKALAGKHTGEHITSLGDRIQAADEHISPLIERILFNKHSLL
ncbi:hypothetical protein [Thalassobacillus pellis]|uniref:hypothetical protein n=1 Tax=Thalassobacillus pellis TaxID=748008 RepID=UPI00195F90B9|nr:hypothetical protein [Thalassobacillus pellis]MBM7553221.1 hypothetical protein [Thalassobacillus pellis]